MDKLLAAFTIRQMYTSVTIYNWLIQNNKTMKDLDNYLETKRSSVIQSGYITNLCPECKTIMRILKVNTSPGDQVGNDENGVPYQSQWICPRCFYAEYSIKDSNNLALSFMKKIEEGGI
jgi:hypothetical protein